MRRTALLVLAFAGAASAQLFSTQEFPTAAGPMGLVVADLDGDGLADAALAANGAQQIVLHRGDGRLGLLPAELVAAAGDIVALDAGDIDGDGWLDLVGAATAEGKLVYVHALGGGAFGAPVLKGGTKSAGGVVLVDMNGDGKLDAVVSATAAYSASIFLNQSGDLATPPSHVGGSGSWTDIVAADFDGDGQLDVAQSGMDGRVQVLPGNGLGGVGAPLMGPQLAVGGADLATGDLDADGHPDLLVCEDDLFLLPGLGDGSFGAAVTTAISVGAAACVDVADLDGDGALDAAVGSNHGRLESFLGDGSGGLVAHGWAFVGGEARATRLRDANGDGRIDAFVADGAGNMVMVRGGDGLGAFSGPETVPAAGSGPGPLTIGDANGDGRPDVVASWGPTQSTQILTCDAQGQLAGAVTLPGGPSPSDVDLLDVDADGDADVLVTDYVLQVLHLHRATAPLSFAAPVAISPGAGGPTSLAAADFGAGGTGPDLIVRCNAPVSIRLVADDGAGGFGPSVVVPVAGTMDPDAVADVDLDGDLDVVGAGALPAAVKVLRNSGLGSFTLVQTPIDVSLAGWLAMGDMDEDGLPDAVLAGLEGQVGVLHGNGFGGFALPALTELGFDAHGLRIGDLDGDEHLDVVVSSLDSDTLSCVRGDGHGELAAQEIHGLAYVGEFGLADFDADGRLDAVSPRGSSALHVLRGSTPSPWTSLGHGLAGTLGTPTLLATGSLVGGEPVSIALGSALPNSSAALVIGLSVLGQPFKGGTLVPQPNLLLAGLPTGPGGALTLAGALPPGLPSGLQIVLQWWVVDAGAPKGLAASVGVSGTLP